MADVAADVTLEGGRATGGSCTVYNVARVDHVSLPNAQIRCATPIAASLRKKLAARLKNVLGIRRLSNRWKDAERKAEDAERIADDAKRKAEDLAKQNEMLSSQLADLKCALAKCQAASQQREIQMGNLLAESQREVEALSSYIDQREALDQEWQTLNAASIRVEARKCTLISQVSELKSQEANRRRRTLPRGPPVGFNTALSSNLSGSTGQENPPILDENAAAKDDRSQGTFAMSQPLPQPPAFSNVDRAGCPAEKTTASKNVDTRTDSSCHINRQRPPSTSSGITCGTLSSPSSLTLSSVTTVESDTSPPTPPPGTTEFLQRPPEDYWGWDWFGFGSDANTWPQTDSRDVERIPAFVDVDDISSALASDVSFSRKLTTKFSQYFISW
ncbi:hypothetical protein B0T16DRAFT_414986 [Cercophora newfieldiana]|uniref:Uncharacterized protein n=1 Tax=Cercophora newfieldiana TaxID=92897 RepID=A0AA39XZ73_9PEZI|nr:hypothetical protein B0T16DRAFT_414986 [Cercophora newfieldiana]